MSLWDYIRGTTNTHFGITASGSLIKYDSAAEGGAGRMQIRNNGDDAFANLQVLNPVYDQDAVSRNYLEQFTVKAVDTFEGGAPPSAGMTEGWWMCTTSAGSYTENVLYYADGATLSTTRSLDTTAPNGEGRLIWFTLSSTTGSSSVEFTANSLYAWDGAAWTLIGPAAGSTGQLKMILIDIPAKDATPSQTASSTTTIANGDWVVDCGVLVTGTYEAGVTIELGYSGSDSFFMGSGLNNPQTLDLSSEFKYTRTLEQNSGSAQALQVTLSTAGTGQGAGKAYIKYVTASS